MKDINSNDNSLYVTIPVSIIVIGVLVLMELIFFNNVSGSKGDWSGFLLILEFLFFIVRNILILPFLAGSIISVHLITMMLLKKYEVGDEFTSLLILLAAHVVVQGIVLFIIYHILAMDIAK